IHPRRIRVETNRLPWLAVLPDNRLSISGGCLPQPLLPSTAFADSRIQVDRTDNPRFFVNLLDATRARLLERARASPREFFAPLRLRPGLTFLDVGCGTGGVISLLAPIVSPGTAVGVDLSETMIAEARQRSSENVDNL